MSLRRSVGTASARSLGSLVQRQTRLWKLLATASEHSGYRRWKETHLSLERLGLIYCTDKATHVRNGRSYCGIYEEYLRRPDEQFTLLELGVRHGASLRMWNAYFPQATIIGLDVDPAAVSRASEFQVYVGSQDDAALLNQIADEHPSLEVVVDDASHMNPLTFASFAALCSETGSYDCDLGPWDESVPAEVAFVHVWPSILIVGRN